jgi:hypothetical protein
MTLAELRGYAVPFDQTICLRDRGTFEQFHRRAFDAMLGRPFAHVDIRWGGHDEWAPVIASTRDGTAGFFADKYGLGFWCRLEANRTGWSVVGSITRRRAPCDQCSIGGLIVIDRDRDRYLGATRETIRAARINHIALCGDAAYRQGTGVWPTHLDLADAPWRIQSMAESWSHGRRQFLNFKAKRAELIASAQRIVRGAGEGPGGDLSAIQLAKVTTIASRVRILDAQRVHAGERRASR